MQTGIYRNIGLGLGFDFNILISYFNILVTHFRYCAWFCVFHLLFSAAYDIVKFNEDDDEDGSTTENSHKCHTVDIYAYDMTVFCCVVVQVVQHLCIWYDCSAV